MIEVARRSSTIELVTEAQAYLLCAEGTGWNGNAQSINTSATCSLATF